MGGGALKLLIGSANIARNTMVNHVEQQQRQERLEDWYKKDGRGSKRHPMHSLYTGLAEKYMNKEQENA
jgi:hypothetical protein